MNDELLRITAPTFGPSGLGRRSDGKVVMVSGALPGDVVRYTVTDERADYDTAVLSELVEPSSDRRPSPCPYRPDCGGCTWIELNVDAQRRHKLELVKRALKAVPHAVDALDELMRFGPEFGYRRRARFCLESAASESSDSNLQMGFFALGTHRLVPVEKCMVCIDRISQAISALQELGIQPGMTGAAEVTATQEGEAIAAFFFGLPYHDMPAFSRKVVGSGILNGVVLRCPGQHETRAGRTWITVPVTSEPDTGIPIPATGFAQANQYVNSLLVREAVDAVSEVSTRCSVLELHAGHGNFTRSMLKAGHQVTAVEIGVDLNLIEPHPGLTFLQGDAGRTVRRLLHKPGFRPDVVILDPPRTGAKDVMPLLAGLRPRSIVYVSCDPYTFARDIKVLHNAGYRVSRIRTYDMMPQTWHVELLGELVLVS